jgi:DNA-binding NarL/FixJ family response regulator
MIANPGVPRAAKPAASLAASAADAEAANADGPALALIEPRALTRQCLRRSLAAEIPQLRLQAFAHPDELPAAWAGPGVALVLLSLGPDRLIEPEAAAMLRALIGRLAEVPVVVLGDADEPDDVIEAIRQGARGYVPTGLDLTEVVEALRFVLAGGTFVPASALMAIAGPRAAAEPAEPDGEAGWFDCLTPRERDVLGQLRLGKPNKVIAYELGIREATVKVFVRRILAKLHAANRTEVAYLAMRRLGQGRVPPA